jgi:hypothetical protein
MSGTTHSTSLTRRVALPALVLLCMMSCGIGETRARAAGPLDFTLKNRLGVTISHVYLSPHQSDSWEEDVLGKSVLADGRDTKITFNAREVARGDIWDLKIKTSDNQEYIWTSPGFNLRKLSEITIILKDGKASAVSK